MLNPTHLRTLGEVLAAGSFAEAANRLGYTPSAVSQQVAALERMSGVTLFERDGRSITPTPAAKALAARAKGVLRSLDALEREVRALSENDLGLVRLGSFTTASAAFVPRALALLRRSHPEVGVHLEEGEPRDILPQLEAGGLDVAVVYRYPWAPSGRGIALTTAPLLEERLFLLVPDPDGEVAAQRSLGQLRGADWIAPPQDSEADRCLHQLCAKAGFAPRIAYRSGDYGVIRAMVRAGLGAAFVPALALGGERDDRVLALPLPDDAPKRQVFALCARVPEDTLSALLIGALTRAASELLPAEGLRAVS